MGRERTVVRFSVAVVALACCALAASCSRSSDSGAATASQKTEIAVTTSILECAVRDVGGEDFSVFRLVPPHSCPGHFDATPADLERIVRAPLFIRHDYQAYLDAKLSRAGKRPRRCVSIPSQAAQTIPENYLAVCEQICSTLSGLAPDKAPALKTRLAHTTERIRKAEADVSAEAARLKGKVVLTSRLQVGFCKWMGLTIAATFDNADQASLKGVEQAVERAGESGAAVVVCNLQRGLREGKVLAERLGLPLIVLSNFPEAGPEKGGYLGLLYSNAKALLRGIAGE